MAQRNRATTINRLHFQICAHEDLEADASLRSLWIEIPDYCHLQCDYCFANTCRNHPHPRKGYLSRDEYLSLLAAFRDCGGKFLGIPGNGEPFHPGNRDLVMCILREATKLGISTTVFTTADAIFYRMGEDRSYEEDIAAGPSFEIMDELAQLDVILLMKCNSLKPEVQDALVRQPGYTAARAKAMAWLTDRYRLNEQGRLGIVTSILPENQDEIVDLYRYSTDHKLKFDCDTILPRGRGKSWQEQHDTLTTEDYRAIYRALDDASGGRMSSGGSYVGVACDRVKHHLYIDIKGDAYPCIGCVGKDANLSLGSIRREGLDRIWGNRKRVLLRDHLDEVVLGPCSWCANFQQSCWSCLGRVVEHFEVSDGQLVLFTKGCFNHRPDWGKWVQHCDRWMRKRISEIPTAVRTKVRDSLRAYGMEAFWQTNPAPLAGGECSEFPKVRKDSQGTELSNLSSTAVWQLLHGELPPWRASQSGLDEAGFQKEYLRYLHELLPRVLLSTLKLILDAYDKPFVPASARIDECEPGLVQFCNLMFFMPSKNRYFYRTIACNSLDRDALASHDGMRFRTQQPEAARLLSRELEIRNREVTLIQRWAETFREAEAAPILPHIKNLSRELEDERVDVYELVLAPAAGDEDRQRESAEIDREVRHHEENVLCVYPLMDSSVIRDRVAAVVHVIAEVTGSDERWQRECKGLSDVVFAYAPEGAVSGLDALYSRMASAAFYHPADLSGSEQDGIKLRVRELIIQTIAENLVLPVDGEVDRQRVQAMERRVSALEWKELFDLVAGENRRVNRHNRVLPASLMRGGATDDGALVGRVYNPALCQFIRLFLREDGGLVDDWWRALNYFVWLGVFRYRFGVRSYSVLHAPNLQQQCQAFIGQNVDSSTPSGMIVSSSRRLPLEARQRLGLVFSTVMDPLEEVASAQAALELGERKGIHDYIHTFKNELDQRVLWRLDLAKWERPDSLCESDRAKLDVVRETLQRTYYVVQAFYVKDPKQRDRLLAQESAVLTPAQLCARFNVQVDTLRDQLLTKRNLRVVPGAQLRSESPHRYWTILPVFDCICFEVILNIADHTAADAGPPSVLMECTDKAASLVVEDTVSPAALKPFMSALAARGTTRISGNRAIELYEELIGVQSWDGCVIDQESRRIRIVYPLARVHRED